MQFLDDRRRDVEKSNAKMHSRTLHVINVGGASDFSPHRTSPRDTAPQRQQWGDSGRSASLPERRRRGDAQSCHAKFFSRAPS